MIDREVLKSIGYTPEQQAFRWKNFCQRDFSKLLKPECREELEQKIEAWCRFFGNKPPAVMHDIHSLFAKSPPNNISAPKWIMAWRALNGIRNGELPKTKIMVLLVKQDGEGVPAWLEVELTSMGVSEPLLQHYELALADISSDFIAALSDAVETVGGLPPGRNLVWNITPVKGERFTHISGRSMGLAMGLVVKAVLADEPVDLSCTAVTGALMVNGVVTDVNSIAEKFSLEVETQTQNRISQFLFPENALKRIVYSKLVKGVSTLREAWNYAVGNDPVAAFRRSICQSLGILDNRFNGKAGTMETDFEPLPLFRKTRTKPKQDREEDQKDLQEDVSAPLRPEGKEALVFEPDSMTHYETVFIDRWLTEWGVKTREKRVVFLGPPGSGKSTFLRWLAWSLVEGRIEEIPPSCIILSSMPGAGKSQTAGKIVERINHNSFCRMLPVPVALGGIKTYFQGDGSLDEFVRAVCGQLSFASLREDTLKEWLETGKVLLLLDGLDEIGDDANRLGSHLLDVIPSDCPVVATCRTLSFDSFSGRGWFEEPLYLGSFDDTSRQHYIHRYFEEEGEADRLIQQLRQRPELAYLAGNPMLLSLICYSMGGKPVLSETGCSLSISALYKDAVDKMVKERRSSGAGLPTPRGQRNLLRKLALHFMLRGEVSFPSNVVLEWLWDTSRCQDADALLEHWITNYMLQEIGDHCQFIHLTIMEFLVAEALEGIGWNEPVQGANCTVKELVDKKCWDPFWERTLRFFAGVLDVGDQHSFSERLMDEERDDLGRHRLRLLMRCMPEMARDVVDKEGRKLTSMVVPMVIEAERVGFAQDHHYSCHEVFPYRRSSLKEIDDEALPKKIMMVELTQNGLWDDLGFLVQAGCEYEGGAHWRNFEHAMSDGCHDPSKGLHLQSHQYPPLPLQQWLAAEIRISQYAHVGNDRTADREEYEYHNELVGQLRKAALPICRHNWCPEIVDALLECADREMDYDAEDVHQERNFNVTIQLLFHLIDQSSLMRDYVCNALICFYLSEEKGGGEYFFPKESAGNSKLEISASCYLKSQIMEGALPLFNLKENAKRRILGFVAGLQNIENPAVLQISLESGSEGGWLGIAIVLLQLIEDTAVVRSDWEWMAGFIESGYDLFTIQQLIRQSDHLEILLNQLDNRDGLLDPVYRLRYHLGLEGSSAVGPWGLIDDRDKASYMPCEEGIKNRLDTYIELLRESVEKCEAEAVIVRHEIGGRIPRTYESMLNSMKRFGVCPADKETVDLLEEYYKKERAIFKEPYELSDEGLETLLTYAWLRGDEGEVCSLLEQHGGIDVVLKLVDSHADSMANWMPVFELIHSREAGLGEKFLLLLERLPLHSRICQIIESMIENKRAQYAAINLLSKIARSSTDDDAGLLTRYLTARIKTAANSSRDQGSQLFKDVFSLKDLIEAKFLRKADDDCERLFFGLGVLCHELTSRGRGIEFVQLWSGHPVWSDLARLVVDAINTDAELDVDALVFQSDLPYFLVAVKGSLQVSGLRLLEGNGGKLELRSF